jgi:hypothetical protein
MLAQLANFAKTQYDPDFDVYFTKTIKVEDVEVLGLIQGKQIWLKVDQPLAENQLLLYYGIPFYYDLKKLNLIEGEQYFFALLHEISHSRRAQKDNDPVREEFLVNESAADEFKKKRGAIRKALTFIQEKTSQE